MKVASAIMTTDTRPKVAFTEIKLGDKKVRIAGIAKGSGMIAPNLATMFSFIFTDADISSVNLNKYLNKVLANTFNAITIDSDTSTNDMVAIFATKKVKNKDIISYYVNGQIYKITRYKNIKQNDDLVSTIEKEIQSLRDELANTLIELELSHFELELLEEQL